MSQRVRFDPPQPTVTIPPVEEWDDEAWCAHGGHVHPVPGCPFCPEVPRG